MLEKFVDDEVAHDLDIAAQGEIVRIRAARLDELGVRVPRPVLLERVADEAAPLGRRGGGGGGGGGCHSRGSLSRSLPAARCSLPEERRAAGYGQRAALHSVRDRPPTH